MDTAQQVERMLDRLHAVPQEDGSWPESRRLFFEAVGKQFPEVSGVVIEEIAAGGRPAEVVAPESRTPRGTILYLHGGAFIIGSPRIYRNQSSRIALSSGCRVVTLDYRLAPEHPFPAALDDTIASFRGLVEQGESPDHIVMAGDSAGANLALGAMVQLRDAGEPLPAAAVCISPWTDLSCRGETMATNANSRHFAQRESLLHDAGHYLAGEAPEHPLASPIHADLSGLPPLLIQVGSEETLVDDARNLARRAEQSGVDVTFEIWSGMVHEWHLLAALLPEDEPLEDAEAAIDQIAGFVYSHLPD
ncbi:MAG: alpha/beta hydrolase [Chloroflexota bacterium]